jgi:hypothetical protein
LVEAERPKSTIFKESIDSFLNDLQVDRFILEKHVFWL